MIRTVLIDLLLFLLPFVLYGLYLLAVKKTREDAAAGHPHPWVALFVAGLVLALAGLVYLGLENETPASQDEYHPHRSLPIPSRHG